MLTLYIFPTILEEVYDDKDERLAASQFFTKANTLSFLVCWIPGVLAGEILDCMTTAQKDYIAKKTFSLIRLTEKMNSLLYILTSHEILRLSITYLLPLSESKKVLNSQNPQFPNSK